MAFMRADCKYPFGGDPTAQAVTYAYISHGLYVFRRCCRQKFRLAAETRRSYPASPRNWAASFLKSIGSASRSPEVWARLSSARAEMSANFIRIGVAIASPNAIASRSAIEDRKAIVLLAETPAAARMIPLSSSLASLIANKVKH
jgi:hypothetical protein